MPALLSAYHRHAPRPRITQKMLAAQLVRDARDLVVVLAETGSTTSSRLAARADARRAEGPALSSGTAGFCRAFPPSTAVIASKAHAYRSAAVRASAVLPAAVMRPLAMQWTTSRLL